MTLTEIKRLLLVDRDNTAYKTCENLVEKGILKRVKKGLYIFTFLEPSDFEVANHLSSPSYISLESALTFSRDSFAISLCYHFDDSQEDQKSGSLKERI